MTVRTEKLIDLTTSDIQEAILFYVKHNMPKDLEKNYEPWSVRLGKRKDGAPATVRLAEKIPF